MGERGKNENERRQMCRLQGTVIVFTYGECVAIRSGYTIDLGPQVATDRRTLLPLPLLFRHSVNPSHSFIVL